MRPVRLGALADGPLDPPTASSAARATAATLAGMLVGSLNLGRLADLVGRQPALLIDLALVSVSALVSAVVTSPDWRIKETP